MFNIFSLLKSVKIRTHMQDRLLSFTLDYFLICFIIIQKQNPESLAWMHSRRMYCERKLSTLELQTPQCFHWKKKLKIRQIHLPQSQSTFLVHINKLSSIPLNIINWSTTRSCCDHQSYYMIMTWTSFQSALIKCIFWYSVPHTFQAVEKSSQHFPFVTVV